ncbi:COPII coat Sec23p-Sfb3p heterodimer component [Coemansia sp. RSA 2611]|nr:COPII coat Sec23p-Sfb3p heterodimer component [Coemansia sp. RSA 2611]
MYMLASGGSLMLWFGRQVSPSLLQAAVGVSALEQIDTKMHSVPEVPTELNQKIRAIAGGLVPTRAGYVNVQIVRQGMDQAEVQFASLLVEDRNNDNMTYVDFVCAIHRQIQVEARPKGPSEPKWSYH